jgi:hypothetical protein
MSGLKFEDAVRAAERIAVRIDRTRSTTVNARIRGRRCDEKPRITTVTVACSSVKIQVFSEGGRERKTLWGSKGPIVLCGCNWRAQSSDSASN